MPRMRSPAKYLICRRWTVADARAALAAVDESGLSLNAFAARQGIDAQRLYYWRRRLAGQHVVALPPPQFVELRPPRSEPVEVMLRSGRVLRVAESIDSAVLIRLVAALEHVEPC
jgi:transposase-like protein